MLIGGDESVGRFFGLNPWTAIITMAVLGVGGMNIFIEKNNNFY
jgi:hypothetical protein